MIRATSSRSTRPNHMSNQIDSPKAPGLADFGRGAGDIHSVAKQAPFCIAFRVDFGGQKPHKIDEISSLGALCFLFAFRAANLMIFGEPGSWKTLILPSKNKVFRKISCPPTSTFFDGFSIPKSLQNPLNLASKRYCFLTSFSKRILMIFASNLEVQKPLNFQKIDAFGQRWWWTCSGSALGFDFGTISKRFGTKFYGFCFQMYAKSQDLLRIFVAKSKVGVLQASSSMTFWTTCADD